MGYLSNEQKGALCAITSGIFYSFVGYFGMSVINADHSASNMTFWRFLVSSALISFILIPRFKAINENFLEMLKMLIYGAVFYGVGVVMYFVSSKYIGTGLAMVIFFTYPAMVMFLNWLLYKKGMIKTCYLSIFIITVGLILLVDISEFKLDIVGVGLSILSAILYAFYIVFSKKSKLSALVSTYMVCIGCTIASLMLALVDQSFAVPMTLSVWINILGIGIICTALPILLLLEGLKRISAEKASILSVLEPVFVVIFGVTLLGEKINLLQCLGIITVLLGALITLFDRRLMDNGIFQK